MKRIATILFTIVLVAGMFVLLGFIRNEHGNAVCRNLRISIDYRSSDTLITKGEIEKLLISRFDTLQGKNVQTSHLSKIRETVANIPYVETCDVDFLLNGTLRIRARQRVPVLRVMTGGQSWFIDTRGVVMPRHLHHSARVPVADGHLGQTGMLKTANNLQALADTNHVFASGRLNQLIVLANYIYHHESLKSMIEQIHVDRRGEFELFANVGNQRILFGDAQNMEDKFEKLLIFYRSGPSLNRINHYKTIDLKFNNQVVCSKR
jgi:cell division protein FtsQ